MEYSIIGKGQEISAEGVIYDKGSVYERLQKLTDIRKAVQPDDPIDDCVIGKVERGRFTDRDC